MDNSEANGVAFSDSDFAPVPKFLNPGPDSGPAILFQLDNSTLVQTPAIFIDPIVIHRCFYLRNDHTDSCYCRNWKVTPDPGPGFHNVLTPGADSGPKQSAEYCWSRLRQSGSCTSWVNNGHCGKRGREAAARANIGLSCERDYHNFLRLCLSLPVICLIVFENQTVSVQQVKLKVVKRKDENCAITHLFHFREECRSFFISDLFLPICIRRIFTGIKISEEFKKFILMRNTVKWLSPLFEGFATYKLHLIKMQHIQSDFFFWWCKVHL